MFNSTFSKMAKYCAYISALLVCFALGWWLGSRSVEEVVREDVRYVERPITTIKYSMPEPIKVGVNLPRLQYDTIKITERIPTDTAGIIADYFKRREYAQDFSTDSTGTFKVRAVVYCNRLEAISAEVAPLQREVLTTTRNVRVFRPFVGGGVGIGSRMSASVEVGALLKERHLLRVGYQRVGKENYLNLGYGYFFGK